MIKRDVIEAALLEALTGIDLPLEGKQQGKVRDFWSLGGGRRLMVTTDRQSAFDRMLGYVPYKGAVLNQLAAFWFKKTEGIVANHMHEVPDPNVLVSQECQPVPVEMVVRGYMTGVTTTSIWYSYEKGEREIYGLKFPEGLEKNDPLPEPVITPTTHGGATGHDERLTRDQIVGQGLVDADLYAEVERVALELFKFGQEWCREHGLILVDTKYEFGLVEGKLTLMDEIHTPDSSRFWIAGSYHERRKRGEEPENYDKEFIRLWYAKKGYRGDGAPPPMEPDLAVAAAERYIGVYEKLTGEEFPELDYPFTERIKTNLEKAGLIG